MSNSLTSEIPTTTLRNIHGSRALLEDIVCKIVSFHKKKWKIEREISEIRSQTRRPYTEPNIW